LNIPLVRTVGDIRHPKDNLFNRWLHLHATDFFLFTCEANQYRYLSVWPQLEKKSAVIYGGIEPEYFNPDQFKNNVLHKIGFDKNKPVVGIVGRLSKNKDIQTFIKAAKIIIDQMSEVQFLISGDEVSVFKNDLRNFAEELDLNNSILITGRHDPVDELIANIDVGVVASKSSEAISRIAMEFMAMGKPLVVTDVNVLPEIVKNNKNGKIVSPQNPFEMAEAVISLLKDKELYSRISEKNLKESRELYNHTKAARKTLQIYHSILNSVR